jgi:S1-C subfamily serine protease
MEKIVIGSKEISEVVPAPPDQPRALEPKLPPPVPIWAKAAMSPLVLVLPILCLFTLVVRVAMKGLPPRTRIAWLTFLSTLLIISGMLTSIAAVLSVAFVPLPAIVSGSLNELDSKTTYPTLPSVAPLTAKDVSEELKPLVTVISPARMTWFSKNESPSNGLGAGVLLEAGPEGYLILTARHVIDETLRKRGGSRALVAMASGAWAGADVVARHKDLDLCLLWMHRESGSGHFVQPVEPQSRVSDGENIFVIGHPQGLRYTLSTGIVSRTDQDVIQISAAVSPGNSGGPVYDDHGNLVAIVTSMVDRSMSPNAENLNFAVRADAVMEPGRWDFSGEGRKRLDEFVSSKVERK